MQLLKAPDDFQTPCESTGMYKQQYSPCTEISSCPCTFTGVFSASFHPPFVISKISQSCPLVLGGKQKLLFEYALNSYCSSVLSTARTRTTPLIRLLTLFLVGRLAYPLRIFTTKNRAHYFQTVGIVSCQKNSQNKLDYPNATQYKCARGFVYSEISQYTDTHEKSLETFRHLYSLTSLGLSACRFVIL